MAPILRHYGKISKGKVLLINLPLYTENIKSLENKDVEITIKEKSQPVNPDQHAYYRGAVLETALTAECFRGWSADEIHKEFAYLYLGCDVQVNYIRKNGTVVSRIKREVPSTADIGKKRMAEYVDRCIIHLAEEGIVVHSPEQYKLNKYRTIIQKEE